MNESALLICLHHLVQAVSEQYFNNLSTTTDLQRRRDLLDCATAYSHCQYAILSYLIA